MNEDVEIEYVNEPIDAGELAASFADVFRKFTTSQDTSKDELHQEHQQQPAVSESHDTSTSNALKTLPDNENPPNVSKRRLKEQTRMTVAELKQLVSRPELVELHDVTARDPVYLLHMKSAKNSVPVPRHWSSKRRYLQGKRGYEKPPFQLPDFIRQTGIMEMRDSNQEKDSQKSLKAKTRERVQPKMGKIQVDYQQLHDAFFKWQTKSRLTIHGDLYYEGKEFEKKFKKKPGELSNDLRRALGMPIGPNAYRYPPPWLAAMKRHGPPPSYPYLKIPGLNCPFPDEDDDKLSQTSETYNEDR